IRAVASDHVHLGKAERVLRSRCRPPARRRRISRQALLARRNAGTSARAPSAKRTDAARGRVANVARARGAALPSARDEPRRDRRTPVPEPEDDPDALRAHLPEAWRALAGAG